MRRLARILVIALASVTVAVAACGGDDDETGNGADGNGSLSPTVSGSPTATEKDETPGASPDASAGPETPGTPVPTEAAPTPRAPRLDAGVRKIDEGTLNFVLIPAGQFSIDGLRLIQPGKETPPCAAFVFAFSWQITDPFPAGGNAVTWRLTRQDSTEDVGTGEDGLATVGCGQLTAANAGPDAIAVSVHYVIGAIEG